MAPSRAIDIRSECPEDAKAIAEVLRAAFGGDDEAALVDRLRTGGELAVSLVAARDGRIVGHVGFGPAAVATGDISVAVAWLAPLGVLPALQRQGIGSALVRAGLTRARAHGFSHAVVLGDPDYYGRFGFSVFAARGLGSRWPAAALQAVGLWDKGADPLRGDLIEPKAFAALEVCPTTGHDSGPLA